MIKCPICSDLLEELTSIHCQQTHGVTKQQVIEIYGKPKPLSLIYAGCKPPAEYVINERDYLNGQQFTARFRSKNRKFRSDRG